MWEDIGDRKRVKEVVNWDESTNSEEESVRELWYDVVLSFGLLIQ